MTALQPVSYENARWEPHHPTGRARSRYGTFHPVLPAAESAASSQIENLTASARAIAEAELPGAKAKRNAEMIVANTAAMQAALTFSDAVDVATTHRRDLRRPTP